MSDLAVHNTTKERKNMKNITRIFIVCATLFACTSLFGAPGTGKGYQHSGVIGQVDTHILFADWDVLVISDDGQFVTDFLTDADGSFEVDLKPGTYVLVAYITDVAFYPLVYPLVFGTPVTVTVDKKQFATAVLPVSLPPL